jgi:hypothetical protein
MTCDPDKSLAQALEADLEGLTANVLALAQRCQSDSYQLLSLLRTLEYLHRTICMEMFEPSLPDNRAALYQLLRDIEETGGWPYVERMKLKAFLRNFCLDSLTLAESNSTMTPEGSPPQLFDA